MPEPTTAAAAISTVVDKAVAKVGETIVKNLGSLTKPLRDRLVVDLGLGMKSYLEASYNRCRFFKTILNQTQPLEVTQYYVHNTLRCGGRILQDIDLINEIPELKHVAITGLAGSGKSMFMKYLTVCKFENPGSSIPLFVELRAINNISTRDLVEYVRASCIAKGHNVSSDQFRLALSAGTFTIILDGFDELNHEYRDDIAKQILNISQRYPDTPIIISSRPDPRFGAWTTFHVYSVDALTKHQCLQLIDSLEYDSGVRKRFAKEVRERLFDTHTSFLSSPLLTTIMLLTFEEFAEIPVRMHAFYSQAFDTLFQKHDASKEQFQRNTHTSLTKEDFRAIFAAFCAMSYLNQQFSFEEDKLTETIERALNYAKQTAIKLPNAATAKNLILDLKESVCLLQQDGIEITFVHRSFQEFFAAVFATSLSDDKLRRILDKYSVRYNDLVVSMTMDMARESVEQSWVLPTLEQMEKVLDLANPNASISKRFFVMFPHIMYQNGRNGHLLPSVSMLIDKTLGPLETICRLYPEKLGAVHFAKYLHINIKKVKSKIEDAENESKYGYEQFMKLFREGDSNRGTFARFDLSKDNDWWLNIIGADKTFKDIHKAIPIIKRDIFSREKKRDTILDEFL